MNGKLALTISSRLQFMSFFSTVSRVFAVLVVDTIATPLFIAFVLPLSYVYYSVSKYCEFLPAGMCFLNPS